jgi:hypothetical protein
LAIERLAKLPITCYFFRKKIGLGTFKKQKEREAAAQDSNPLPGVFIQPHSNLLSLAKKAKNFNRSVPPPCRQAALPRRKIAIPLIEKNFWRLHLKINQEKC